MLLSLNALVDVVCHNSEAQHNSAIHQRKLALFFSALGRAYSRLQAVKKPEVWEYGSVICSRVEEAADNLSVDLTLKGCLAPEIYNGWRHYLGNDGTPFHFFFRSPYLNKAFDGSRRLNLLLPHEEEEKAALLRRQNQL